MLKVFSSEELELGNIPLTASHKRIAQHLVQAAKDSASISWLLVYGSTAKETQRSSSDVDPIISVIPDKGDLIANWQVTLQPIQVMLQQAAIRHVPCTPVIVTDQELIAGHHTIGAGLLDHLQRAVLCNDLVAGVPLLDKIRIANRVGDSLLQDLHGYIDRKIDKARRFLVYPIELREGEIWHDWLGDIFSVWRHVLRKLLPLYEKNLGCLTTQKMVLLIGDKVEWLVAELEEADTRYHAELGRQRVVFNEKLWQAELAFIADLGWLLHAFLLLIRHRLIQDFGPAYFP